MLGPDDLVYCSGTALGHPFLEKVEAAAEAGFAGISMTIPDYTAARGAGLSDADLRAALRAAGLEIAEVSSVTRWLAGHGDEEEELAIHLVTAFGATGFNATPMNASFRDLDAAVVAFGAVCDRAARRGARCQIEFFPWSGLGDLATAWDIVRRAERPNGGIMFDNWHHFRSGGVPEGLRDVDPEVIFGVQLSDGPAEPAADLYAETFERWLPGEGAMDVAACIRVIQEIGVTAPFSGEPIHPKWSALPAQASAQALHHALLEVLHTAST